MSVLSRNVIVNEKKKKEEESPKSAKINLHSTKTRASTWLFMKAFAK